MAISGSCIPVLVSAPPVRFQASARPSKTSHNVTLTFPPHVNTDLQSQSQVLTFLVAGCYLDGVDLIGEPAFYASRRRCHISSQPQEGNNASSSEKKAPVSSNCLKLLPTSGSHGLSLRRGPCVPHGGSLLKSYQGIASGDVLEKSLVRQETVNLDYCPSPSVVPTYCPLLLGLASPFRRRDSGRSLC